MGILLLSPDIPLFRRVLDWMKKRYPKMTRKADKVLEGFEE
jgi:hypothetical protein